MASLSASFESLPDILYQNLERILTYARDIAQQLRHVQLTPFKGVVCGLLVWVAIVRFFRWRHYSAIHRKYGAKWDEGRGTITPEEAQKIIHVSIYYDMPLLLNYAVAFALFKTYAIPSISKLLAATKQLSSNETISRRYADTEILISTWVACPISGFLDPEFAKTNKGPNPQPAEDPRAMIALARVNWLHARFQISNDDFLYTLCLFVLEPATWARRYGWRSLSPLEEHSLFVLWSEIGKRMGIKDIPESLEAMLTWSKQYEETYMMPAQSNKDVARYTVDELLAAAPQACGIKKLGEKVSICLMDDNVREAMMFPDQPWYMHAMVKCTMASMAFFQRWFMLPRRSPKSVVDMSIKTNHGKNGECPRLHPTKWTARPWYRPEATGIWRYRDSLLVCLGWYSEMPGPHLRSGGYRIEEMGPFKYENSAHEEIMQKASELQGCPVSGPWSLEGKGMQGA